MPFTTSNGTPMRVVTLAKRAADGAWAAKTLPPLVEYWAPGV